MRTGGFTISETPLSTQLYGSYDALMPFLIQTIKLPLRKKKGNHAPKNIQFNRSDYVSDLIFAQYTSYETLDIVLEATAGVWLAQCLACQKNHIGVFPTDDFTNLCLSITQMGLVGDMLSTPTILSCRSMVGYLDKS